MGIGGAIMWPAVLGMTFDALPADKAGLAGGLIIGVAGFGNAAGPLLGGFLTDALELALGALPQPADRGDRVLCHLARHPARDSETGRDRIDYPGIATLSVGLVALLIALDQVTEWGWSDPRILGLFALCVLLLAAFVVIERRAGSWALIPET